jgi:hypothetical protein
LQWIENRTNMATKFPEGQTMKLKLLASGFAVAAFAAGSAYAHHPFGATYVENHTTRIEGKLVQFELRNPHSFIQIESKDDRGQVVLWSVEWAAESQLRSQGVTSRTLRYGDVFTIVGNPGRLPQDHRIRLQSIQRKSDSFRWGGVR